MAQRKSSVTALDSMEVAQQVIKSMRSKSASQQRSLGDGAPLRVTDLNSIIHQECAVVQQKHHKIQEMTAAIEQFEPPHVPLQSSSVHVRSSVAFVAAKSPSPLRSQSARQRASLDSDSDGDSDDELDSSLQSTSASRKTNSLRNVVLQSRKKDAQEFLESCDFEAPDRQLQFTRKKSNSAQIDDFDATQDDEDDEDMQELFKDFVAPCGKHKTSSGGKLGAATGTGSGSTQTHSENNKTRLPHDLLSASAKRGITIKAGQAIRVKPGGSKSRQQHKASSS